jgi:putative ABC transport system substrate-binding protein
MIRRREFITLLGGAAAAWPVAARAQQPTKVARIGFVARTAADSLPERVEAFRAGLRTLGYREGRDIRWADGQYERLPILFDELVRRDVDVIVTNGTPSILAAKQATATIPIVMATSGDAEASGLVASLARPGGNVTGLTFFNPELAAKRFELLKEMLPNRGGTSAESGKSHQRANRSDHQAHRSGAQAGGSSIRRPRSRGVRTSVRSDGSQARWRSRGYR